MKEFFHIRFNLTRRAEEGFLYALYAFCTQMRSTLLHQSYFDFLKKKKRKKRKKISKNCTKKLDLPERAAEAYRQFFLFFFLFNFFYFLKKEKMEKKKRNQ